MRINSPSAEKWSPTLSLSSGYSDSALANARETSFVSRASGIVWKATLTVGVSTLPRTGYELEVRYERGTGRLVTTLTELGQTPVSGLALTPIVGLKPG